MINDKMIKIYIEINLLESQFLVVNHNKWMWKNPGKLESS